jgi:hypothetical protein
MFRRKLLSLSSGKNEERDGILFQDSDNLTKRDDQFKSPLTMYLLPNHEQSEEVQTALYGTDWYRLSPAFKRLVPLMLMRASKAVKLRNGIFNDLCFATFSGVRLFLLQDLGTVLKLGTGTVPYKHKGSSSAAGGNKYWARFAVPKGQGCQHSALAIGVK